MATNPYINQNVRSEQNLAEDITIETIKSMGRDMIYIPRTLVNLDTLFGEDEISKFENTFSIEMYIESIQGFESDQHSESVRRFLERSESPSDQSSVRVQSCTLNP